MTTLVIGGGISGLGAAKLLRKLDQPVRLSEHRELSESAKSAFTNIGVEVRDRGHQADHLNGVKRVVLSPGLPPQHALVRAAQDLGLPIDSEIDLALEHYQGRFIGITGTNGKSTVAALTHHLLQSAGHASCLAGNIGAPPSGLIADGLAKDIMVCELSSYQLAISKPISSDVAIWTSFSPDHLAYHGSLNEYFLAKWRLVSALSFGPLITTPAVLRAMAKHQSAVPSDTILVANAAENDHQAYPTIHARPECLQLPAGAKVSLTGRFRRIEHERINAAFALAAAQEITGETPEKLAAGLAGFKGLAHRLEDLPTWQGRAVVNDSKATNVAATVLALQNQPEPVILLVGGQGKGEDFKPLANHIDRIDLALCFGEQAEALSHVFGNKAKPFKSLADCTAWIKAHVGALPVAPVLLSPACASFDEFPNFEARGDFFRAQFAS